MAKDFTGITAATIAAATQEEPKTQRKNNPRKQYTDQEATAYANNLRTAGRKGVKLQRINLALAPEIYDYVKTMSKGAGMTYTEFLDKILRDHKAKHAEAYKKALDIRNSL